MRGDAMILVFSAVLAAQTLVVWFVVRQASRDRETLLAALSRASSAPSGDTAALIGLVENLCQRLQSPAQAVVDHTLKTAAPEAVPAVSPEDDAGFWASQDIPKEQLAEATFNLHLAG